MTHLSPSSVISVPAIMSKDDVSRHVLVQNSGRSSSSSLGSSKQAGQDHCRNQQKDIDHDNRDTQANSGCPEPKESSNYYGYGDAVPDSERDLYAPPEGRSSSSSPSSQRASRRRGGHEGFDRAPTHARISRRSSLKSSSGAQRRASLRNQGRELEVTLPCQDKPVRRRSSINFNERVKVKKVVPVTHITKDPEALWFQDEEYDKMRKKSFSLVRKAIDGNPGGKNYCFRGLEKYLDREELSTRRNNAWGAVLDEQVVQRDQGELDDEYMANLYKFETQRCRNEAYERARRDEAEIALYMRQTRQHCRRLSM